MERGARSWQEQVCGLLVGMRGEAWLGTETRGHALAAPAVDRDPPSPLPAADPAPQLARAQAAAEKKAAEAAQAAQAAAVPAAAPAAGEQQEDWWLTAEQSAARAAAGSSSSEGRDELEIRTAQAAAALEAAGDASVAAEAEGQPEEDEEEEVEGAEQEEREAAAEKEQEAQEAAESDGRSPYERALQGCESLACLKAAAEQVGRGWRRWGAAGARRAAAGMRAVVPPTAPHLLTPALPAAHGNAPIPFPSFLYPGLPQVRHHQVCVWVWLCMCWRSSPRETARLRLGLGPRPGCPAAGKLAAHAPPIPPPVPAASSST